MIENDRWNSYEDGFRKFPFSILTNEQIFPEKAEPRLSCKAQKQFQRAYQNLWLHQLNIHKLCIKLMKKWKNWIPLNYWFQLAGKFSVFSWEVLKNYEAFKWAISSWIKLQESWERNPLQTNVFISLTLNVISA